MNKNGTITATIINGIVSILVIVSKDYSQSWGYSKLKHWIKAKTDTKNYELQNQSLTMWTLME